MSTGSEFFDQPAVKNTVPEALSLLNDAQQIEDSIIAGEKLSRKKKKRMKVFNKRIWVNDPHALFKKEKKERARLNPQATEI